MINVPLKLIRGLHWLSDERVGRKGWSIFQMFLKIPHATNCVECIDWTNRVAVFKGPKMVKMAIIALVSGGSCIFRLWNLINFYRVSATTPRSSSSKMLVTRTSLSPAENVQPRKPDKQVIWTTNVRWFQAQSSRLLPSEVRMYYIQDTSTPLFRSLQTHETQTTRILSSQQHFSSEIWYNKFSRYKCKYKGKNTRYIFKSYCSS